MRHSSYVIMLLLLSLFSSKLEATHIVGGELNYTCLGNNQYEISLTVFRDCFFGNPNAYFDDPAAIGIFDANNNLVDTLMIPLMGDDTLSPTLVNPCLVIPPDVCVHTTTYRAITTLPFIPGGYQLSYQRCCRNQTILNIVNPLATGATYYNEISEDALQGCNSSAVFTEWPPILICANLPIEFDHSAIDADGDSLVYELCAPFTGADQNFPIPQPPNPPPYDSVTWQLGYGTYNMLLGPNPLSIDSETGFLTGTPVATGQYVVGICVKEYRNGVLISTSKRDFQYNVGICELNVITAFSAPEVLCDNSLTVYFGNETTGGSSFLWDFGDPTTQSDVSSAFSPFYTYPDTGTYEITLIASEGSGCADTFSTTVNLQYESLEIDFELSYQSCSDSTLVSFLDQSIDSISYIEEWLWEWPGGSSTDPNPVIHFENSGSYTIELTVTAANGCMLTTSQTVVIDDVTAFLQDTVVSCDGNPIVLNPGGDPSYLYNWSPGTGLSSTTDPSPTASPTMTTVYTVEITTFSLDTCMISQEVTYVVPAEQIWVEAQNDTVICDLSLFVTANSNTATQYIWDNDLIFDTPLNLAGMPSAILSPNNTATTFYVKAIDVWGCEAIDSVTLTSNAINVDLVNDWLLCDPDTIEIEGINTDPSDMLTWTWTPLSEILSGEATSLITVSPSVPTTYYLQVENQYNCVYDDSVLVFVPEPLDVFTDNDTIICDSDYVLTAYPSATAVDIIWAENTSFDTPINSSGAASVMVSPGINSTYYVLVKDQYDCEAIDSIIISSYNFTLEASPDKLLCDGNEVELEVIPTGAGNQNYTYTWFPLTDIISGETTSNPIVSPSENTTYKATVQNQYGCVEEIGIYVQVSDLVPPLDLQATPDSLYQGETSQLEATLDTNYIYNWLNPLSLTDSTIYNPVSYITEPITYYLEIFDEFGCKNLDSVSLFFKPFICDDPYIFVPNAFTPNGDGFNDILYVRANSITDVYFAVYNRWGELMFETETLTTGWDGNYKGKELSPDVYAYYLQVRCFNEQEYFKKGNVTLIR